MNPQLTMYLENFVHPRHIDAYAPTNVLIRML